MSNNKHAFKILFLQHADALGGSVIHVSTIGKFLRDEQGWEVCIACPKNANTVIEFYKQQNFKVVEHGLKRFPHTTGGTWFFWNLRHWIAAISWFFSWKNGVSQVKNLVESGGFDLVVYNSLTLVPFLQPFNHAKSVVHVNECAVSGLFGVRQRWLKNFLKNNPSPTIFLCEYDRKALKLNETTANTFVVSSPTEPGIHSERNTVGAGFVALFMGGIWNIKGTHVLMGALEQWPQDRPRPTVLLSNWSHIPSSSRLKLLLSKFGFPTYGEQIWQRLKTLQSQGWDIRPLGIVKDMRELIRKCDVLLCPSTKPHFSRPTIEAGLEQVPSIVSNLEGLKELVDHNVTGLKIKPGSSIELRDAILSCIDKKVSGELQIMGEKSFVKLKSTLSPKVVLARLLKIYSLVLPEGKAHINLQPMSENSLYNDIP